MPFKQMQVREQRVEFVIWALRSSQPLSLLCQEFDISRPTGYKWIARYRAGGVDAIAECSRRPHRSPRQTAPELETKIIALRQVYPDWGARKLAVLLARQGIVLPSSTVHRVLLRHGLVRDEDRHTPAIMRFARERPNELWQMDFKGALQLGAGSGRERAVPLTLIDDHSRFLVSVHALADHRLETFWPVIWDVFGEYGLPQAILTDNENGLFASHGKGVTRWTARLWRLGIRHPRGRPYHPQTQGKVERSHGTLQLEALAGRLFMSRHEMQQAMDEFRTRYNHVRPHEALGQLPPITRYAPSAKPRPKTLPPVQYEAGADLRTVTQAGYVSVRGCRLHVGEGLAGEHVEVRDAGEHFSLRYAAFQIRALPWDRLRKGEWL